MDGSIVSVLRVRGFIDKGTETQEYSRNIIGIIYIYIYIHSCYIREVPYFGVPVLVPSVEAVRLHDF